jgi:hypothetical protein
VRQRFHNHFQDRVRKITAGVEPRRRCVECITAIGHDVSKSLVGVREGVALPHLDNGRKSIGNRCRNGRRAPFSFSNAPVLEMFEHARELGREGVGSAEQEAIIRAPVSFAPLGIVALRAAQEVTPAGIRPDSATSSAPLLSLNRSRFGKRSASLATSSGVIVFPVTCGNW